MKLLIEIIKEAYKEYQERSRLIKIAKYVCIKQRIKFAELSSKTRKRHITLSRYLYIALAMKHTNKSWKAICDLYNIGDSAAYHVSNNKMKEPEFIKVFDRLDKEVARLLK